LPESLPAWHVHEPFLQEVPAQTIMMPLPTPQGSLMVTAVSLVYCYIKNGQLQKTANKAFMPANVIRAMYL
jgi:ABC-type protease/lipase transport system fused ATPase/permease subunit